MTTQINLRLSDTLLIQIRSHSRKGGFDTVQDYIKETLREKIFEQDRITPEGLELMQKLIKISDEKGLWGTEEDLRRALRRKTNGVQSPANMAVSRAGRLLKR